MFDWNLEKYGTQDYWLATSNNKKEPGIDGALMAKKPGMTSTVNTIGVPNLDEYMKKVVAAGGKIVVPKMAVTQMGYLAYAVDTEGNVFGMMENDKNAK